MEGDLSPTEERLLQTIKKLRAQNDELVAENDALHLRCERQEATIKDLTDASFTQQSGRDSSHDSYAVVARPDSVEPHSDHEPVAPATPDAPPFKVMAEVLVRHDHRLTDLEGRLKAQEVETEQAEVRFAASCTAQDLQRRVLSLEARPKSVASDGSGNNSTDPGKEHKRIMRALDQFREFQNKIERREKDFREIDMTETRERLYELYDMLNRSKGDDQQVRRAGPFEGTSDDFSILRVRIVRRLASMDACDQEWERCVYPRERVM
ncbi:hypothetical protein CKM354_000435200 [Cercospora kikuchii]|uniref:Uncharacterized protein n=1 Tax=Cercospora kikuchii TaxID=84275 RepID=A0A9P3CJQ1_9PEZI|nr:uncharacterized protein CKM354_000435200 [Cercospora kikuchii]GIZ41035.1 hypothetical protein CKM354_000435200 [Cercospora kikuchii]